MSEEHLAPLLRHELDMVPPEMTQIFRDIIKYRVDPAGYYYKIDIDQIVNQLRALDTGTVHGIDSEFRYEEKGKMFDPVIQSFTMGAGGQITTWDKSEPTMIPAILRGITKRKQMDLCRQRGRDFYYIDTGYFGNGKKKTYHRVTKNDVQNFGPIIERPGDRFERTGIKPAKCRADGSKILLAPPSQKLLNLYDIDLETWLETTLAEIATNTDREVIVRRKPGRTARTSDDSMEAALSQDIYCLITFSSIAAGEALMFGKPAITLGPNAAAPLCSQSLSEIENIRRPSLDEIHAWCRHIAYCQFTEAEMRDGTAWRILQGG
jgi:hypothetical protein